MSTKKVIGGSVAAIVILIIAQLAVPSPPSATGLTDTVASGSARRIPCSAAVPAWREVRLPLNESIATIIFIRTPFEVVIFS